MVKENEFSIWGFVVWACCAVFFLYEFLLRTVIGTFQHPIMYDLELSSFKFSILSSSMYLFIYGMMQIPAGLIIDNYGLKKSLFIATIICAISAIGFAYSQDYYTALAFRMLTGLGSSFGFIGLLVAVYNWMPQRHSGLYIGLSQFIGTMGPMFAAGPLDSIAQSSSTDWRVVFNVLGILGIGLAIVIFMLVKNKQNKEGDYIILQRPESVKARLKRLVTRSQPLYIAIFSALLYFSIEYLSENEGKAFIILKGLGSSFASYMLTLSWLGYAIGCPLLGFISDRMKKRKPVIIFASFCCLIALLLIVLTASKPLMIIAFFLLGIGASGQSVGFALMAEQFKSSYIAVGLSFNNMFITTIASINAPIIGSLIDYLKTNDMNEISVFQLAFIPLIIFAVIALIIPVFLVKETYGRSNADFTYLKS